MSNISKLPGVPESTPDSTPTAIIEAKSDKFYGLSKFDHDLYKEDDDISLPVIRVKRISLPNNGERWKVFSDAKVTLVIEGGKLTKKEKEFLRSVEGASWLLVQAKIGIKSFNAFKKELKAKLATKDKPSKNETKKKLK
jgi:hypothetical protein